MGYCGGGGIDDDIGMCILLAVVGVYVATAAVSLFMGRAEELLQPVVAELPHSISQSEHVLEELVHGVPPQQVVAGNRAELRPRRFRNQPGTEDLRPLGAGGTPRSHL